MGAAAFGFCSPLARKFPRLALLGLMTAIFSGCAIKRSAYDVPEVPLPAQYKNALPENPPESSSVSVPVPIKSTEKTAYPNASEDLAMAEWWRSFGNVELLQLVDRALGNNPDLRIATLHMAQAKARANQVRAGLLPTFSAPMGAANQAPGGAIGSVPVGTENKTSQKSYQASLRGSWRVDVWGEQSALAESAKFQIWQAVFDRDNVQRTMVANLAANYIEYLSLNDRLQIAHETERLLSDILAGIEKRVDAGDATQIDFDQQKAAIFAVRATIPNLEQQREDALINLAFLVGTLPGSLKLSGDGLATLNLPTVIPELPASLLLRRPDVRLAEARLLAADADLDVARARILPALDLSTQLGYSSLALARLFQPSSFFWNAISNLTTSIFDGGKLASEQEMAQAIHEEMVETYARAIFQAVKEVESALASVRLTDKRLDAQQEATTLARRAWESSAEVYALGGIDYLALLDTERSYHRYLDEYQRIKMDRYRGYISLFQALGGGIDFNGPLPGKGIRPNRDRAYVLASGRLAAQGKDSVADGVDWQENALSAAGDSWTVDNDWQVELPGLYHRSTIAATSRDLRTRFPRLMDSRVIRPRLQGQLEDSTEGQVSWYRLYVNKFASPEAAHELCAALQANYQRCRVVSSHSDETILAPPLPENDAEPVVKSSMRLFSSTALEKLP